MRSKLKSLLVTTAVTVAMGCACTVAQADEFIVNGGFESVIPNTALPSDWTGSNFQLTFNAVVSDPVHNGQNSWRTGNLNSFGPAVLSQTFSDVVGATYNVSFFVQAGDADPGNFFTVNVGGQSLTLTSAFANTPFTEFGFSFTGNGSDTLSITATNDPDFWFVDDVSVQGPSVSSVPGPIAGAGLPGLLAGFGAMLAWYRKRRTVVA